jgi:hypothetical protein
MKLFGANKIVTEKIAETDLSTYLVGFDINDNGDSYYRIDSLIKLLIKAVPEFALGCFGNNGATQNEDLMEVAVNSAKAIYKVDVFQKVRDIYGCGGIIEDDVADRYMRKGEFGELILHVLLRDFKGSLPLISKIYFRDSLGTAVHGFDAVHIQPDTKSLWLGESKIYQDGKQGVKALIGDIKEHITNDYMQSEFGIVSRKIELFDDIPERKYWVNLLDSSTTLKEQLDNITIPLLCTYESNNFSKYNDETITDFIKDYEQEVRDLKAYFDAKNDHPLKSKLNIVLLLFPVQSKKELISRMHKNLSILQSVGEL